LARKASDLMSLLAHRGSLRRRLRPGFLQQFGATLRSVVAGRREAPMPRRRMPRTSPAIIGAVLACVGTGYLLGNVFPWSDRSGSELRANQREGIAPGPIGEAEDLRPLATQCYLTAFYAELGLAATAAKGLRRAGIPKARLREVAMKDGHVHYGLVVYYDGQREQEQTRAALLEVAAPDATFDGFRKAGKGWPLVLDVR
jgi:hypothetical protein